MRLELELKPSGSRVNKMSVFSSGGFPTFRYYAYYVNVNSLRRRMDQREATFQIKKS